MTIDDIITRAGGARAISEASAATRKPVSPSAVYKWRRFGIDDDHWALLLRLADGLTVEAIYTANRRLEETRGPRRRCRDACAA